MPDTRNLDVNKDDLHEFRKQIDALIQTAEYMRDSRPTRGGCEISLVHTKLQEAKMWTGKVLEALGASLPKEFADKAE